MTTVPNIANCPGHLRHLRYRGRTSPPSRRLAGMRGFSMIEVLVSIVVLSFGLLGVAGLQAAALKSNQDARLQSVAISLAREMAEMMRANIQVAGDQSSPYYGDFRANADGQLAPSARSTCLDIAQGGCNTTNDVARAEMTEWLSRVGTALPNARVSICRDTAPYDDNGLPMWACTAPTAASDNVAYIKIGWTRANTQGQLESASAARPSVVLPIAPGGQL